MKKSSNSKKETGKTTSSKPADTKAEEKDKKETSDSPSEKDGEKLTDKESIEDLEKNKPSESTDGETVKANEDSQVPPIGDGMFSDDKEESTNTEEDPLVISGSSIHESSYEIGDEEVQLITIVQKSLEESGLNIKEWNALEDDDRNSKIDFTLDAMLNEVEQKKKSKKEQERLDFIENIKDSRLLIDEAMQLAEVSLGKRNSVSISLFKSKAWLGKLLGQAGTVNPYVTENPVTAAHQIPPTSDVAQRSDKQVYDFKLKNDIEKLVYLRELLEKNVQHIEQLDPQSNFIEDKRLASIAKTQSYVNLCEARFELGYELSLIRDKNK